MDDGDSSGGHYKMCGKITSHGVGCGEQGGTASALAVNEGKEMGGRRKRTFRGRKNSGLGSEIYKLKKKD